MATVTETAGARPIVSASGLTVTFGPRNALDGVDLTVHRGELVGLAGENGAGKSTLLRCIAGDLTPTRGRVQVAGAGPRGGARAARASVGVVWQEPQLADNLDVAANLLLGRERRGVLRSESRSHLAARRILAELGIPLRRTTEQVSRLTSGQRQLLALARAVATSPEVLLLDEPTAVLGVHDAALVEKLIARLHGRGTTILMVSHDVEQLIRLTDRILVLRHGRLVADVEAARTHRDDVVALLSGQEPEASAHQQLSRLHALTDRLATADPSSSLSVIVNGLGAALGGQRLCLHVVEGGSRLRLAGALDLPRGLGEAWQELPFGPAGGPMGVAAASGTPQVHADVRTGAGWQPFAVHAFSSGVAGSWSVPFSGSEGLAGVVTVLRDRTGRPSSDELDLVMLYGGYAAGALQREKLLRELTSRNLVLETIREVLETLAGPIPVPHALETALQALRNGLHAEAVALFTPGPEGGTVCRARVDAADDGETPLPEAVARHRRRTEATARVEELDTEDWPLAVSFRTADGLVTLVARPGVHGAGREARALLEDAASSVRLALARERAQIALQEAAALRRSQQLQREFLARLSHELRTPLTAISGYAESLLQEGVVWDQESHDRFLARIGAESTRLRRLVEDLLDYSAIEAGVLRLQRDWCDLGLLLDAARACLDPAARVAVVVRVREDVPVVWADHDRLEQVFLNLLDNAVRHNPPGTQVRVECRSVGDDTVGVEICDDGTGLPASVLAAPFEPRRDKRGPTAGAGLGLSIAHAVVTGHGGKISVEQAHPGTRFVIALPVGAEEPGDGPGPGDATSTPEVTAGG